MSEWKIHLFKFCLVCSSFTYFLYVNVVVLMAIPLVRFIMLLLSEKSWVIDGKCMKVGYYLDHVSISDKTSYCKISWNCEVARSVFKIVRTPRNLMPMCLSNIKAIRKIWHPISRLRDFARCHEKTSYRILKLAPGCDNWIMWGFQLLNGRMKIKMVLVRYKHITRVAIIIYDFIQGGVKWNVI